MAAGGGGGEELVSMDDSDRENFRRRGRSPASKKGGGHERGRERRERDEHEFATISERGGKVRRERSPALSNRGGSGGERERGEQEFGRNLERRNNGRRERSPGSIGGGSTHDRERDEENRPARGSKREDGGRRREKSPSSRRRGGVSSRDRERSERDYGRISERRDEWRRDRSPGFRSGGGRESESRYARGLDRGGNGRRERRGDSRERGHGQDDFGRGGYGRRDYSRRDRSASPRVTDYRAKDQGEDDERPREGFEAGDSRKRDRSPMSHDGSLEKEFEGRDRNSDADSLQEIKRVKDDSLSPGEERDIDYDIKQAKGGREIQEEEKQRRHPSLVALEETSDSGSGQRKSEDEDGSDVGGDSEQNGEGKVQVLSKIATEHRRNATSEDDGGGNLEGRVRGGRRFDVVNGFSGEESEEDEESDGDRKSRKRKPKKREKEKHSRKHREESRKRSHSRGKKRKHRRRHTSSDEATSESDSASSSESELSESEDSEQREKARKQRRKRRRKEKEKEAEREMKRKLKKKKRELKEKKLRAELKKKKKEMRSKKPITTSWGKYGILKDIDMWNKKPEFGAWLAEVKKVNIETLTNWEEKQMFKEYMEDYNTATFPSKKYYNLDDYHRRKVAKARMKGMAQALNVERTDFNDEDDRRLELQKEREKQKEADVQDLMRKMQGGMAQDMREQAQLREEMQYQFRLGNTEAAQAIQRRLDPDADKFTK